MRATLVAVTRCLRSGRCGSTSLSALTLTVQVHSVWIRFRDRYPHRESRHNAIADGRTVSAFDITGFGVVSARDIHIDRNDSACYRSSHLWVAQHFEWLRVAISTTPSPSRHTGF